jgi:hypothetical protein
MPHPTRLPKPQVLALTLACSLVLLTTFACGGKSPDEERVPIPPVSNLREAADHLVRNAEQIEGPPEWLNHERDDGESIYAIGTARANRDEAQDLFAALEDGRNSVIGWLNESGLDPKSPLGYSGDLDQDRRKIQFADLVFDTQGRTWYVLAVLDKTQASTEAAAKMAGIEDMLDERKAIVLDPRTSEGDRVRTALSLLYLVDERAQWNARHAYFAGEPIPAAAGYDRDSMVRLARSVLSEHQVRVVVEGASLPGLEAAIESVLGEFYMSASEFGTGLVYVTLEETTSESAGMELLVLDGLMQLTLEGEAGRSVTSPLRAVTTYDNLDAARTRNARIVDGAAIEAVRAAILQLMQ